MKTINRPPVPFWTNGQDTETCSEIHVIEQCMLQSICLLGETHNRLDHHKWQLDICSKFATAHGKITLGFEMFPKRLQPVLNDWTQGNLTKRQFLEQSEWATVWGFDPDLYMPLFQFCKDHHLPMIALNCDRQLVRDIGKLGWEAVEEERLEGLSKAKPARDDYRRYLFEITGGARPDRTATSPEDPAFDQFVRAQQMWDRAFACTIAHYHKNHPDTLIIGIIGSGHLEYGFGTPFQLDDLGLSNHAVLLPTDETDFPKDIADFVYHIAEE